MGRLNWKALGIGGLCAAGFAAYAQSPAPGNIPAPGTSPAAGATPPAPANTVGGTATMDLIRLRGVSPSVPLRNGAIVPNSERVILDGVSLSKGVDYSIDNESGVIYLMRPQKPGQMLSVNYRYEPGKAKLGFTPGIGSFRFDLVPRGLSLMMGLGMALRGQDGSIATSNIFGFNNNVRVGAGALRGVMIVGEQQNEAVQNGFAFNDPKASATRKESAEHSRMILQNLSTKVMGGTVTADLQDISGNFNGFASLEGAGYDKAAIQGFAREAGLRRTGLALNGLNFGGLKISNGFRNVSDDDGAINWRTFGLEAGGLKFNWRTQEIDEDFKRFQSLAEGDREQLAKEAGMKREDMAGQLATGLGAFSFTDQTVRQPDDQSIRRRQFSFDSKRLRFMMGSQQIDTGFNRFGSLFEAERGQWGREAGMARQTLALNAAILGGSQAQPLTFSQQIVQDTQEAGYKAQDLSVGSSNWSLQHSARKVDQKFGRLGSLAEAEWDSAIRSIGDMYEPGIPFRPEERGWFLQSAGIDRSSTRFNLTPWKDTTFSFRRLVLEGKEDGGQVDTFALNSRQLNVRYRQQSLGEKFGEVGRLLELERQRLGVVAGMDRKDLSADLKAMGRNLSVSTTEAETAKGGLSRQTLKLNDKNLELSVATRKVDKDFEAAGHLVDPERELFAQLRGFEQRESSLKWQILPNLRLEHFSMEAQGLEGQTEEDRFLRNTLLSYRPDKSTGITLWRFGQQSNDPLSKLYANFTERLTVSRDFGKAGRINYLKESQDFSGKNAAQPDVTKEYMSYETRLNDRMSLKSERTTTSFSDGQKENISSQTISTALGRRSGVSMTDTTIDRKGGERDENRRNYGFWYDIAQNFRLSYGYNHHIQGESGLYSNFLTVGTPPPGDMTPDKVGAIQPGTIGGISLAGAYGANQWQNPSLDQRTQAFSNVRMGSVRPMRLGPLRDFTFNFGYDAAADNLNWMRENRLFGAQGKLGANTIGYEYRSQMVAGGERAVDRLFTLNTGNSERAKVVGSVAYKVRTLPNDQNVMFRNFNLTFRPTKGLSLTHQFLTNPEVPNGQVPLGTIAQGVNVNRWTMDYRPNADTTFTGVFDEKFDERSRAYSTTGGLNVTLFQRSGSPLSLYYGIEQSGGNIRQTSIERYFLRFDQRPGPNQSFSIYAGNVTYVHNIAEGFNRNNWQIRLDYSIRF